MTIELWAEKHEPKTLDEYIFADAALEADVRSWVKEGDIPHLLLCGPPGVGKTCLGKLLLDELNIDSDDIKFKNSSDDNSVQVIREEIRPFAQNMSMDGRPRFVFLDEGDGMSPEAQKALRGVIDQTQQNARFIITANYPQNIIPALRDSRLLRVEFKELDYQSFMARVAAILSKEGKEVEIEPLQWLVDKCYPDMRAAIKIAREKSRTGKLVKPATDLEAKADWQDAVVEFVKTQGVQSTIRKKICETVPVNDYVAVYKHLYKNMEAITDNAEKHPEILLAIRDGMYKHAFVADPEINLVATLEAIKMEIHG